MWGRLRSAALCRGFAPLGRLESNGRKEVAEGLGKSAGEWQVTLRESKVVADWRRFSIRDADSSPFALLTASSAQEAAAPGPGSGS